MVGRGPDSDLGRRVFLKLVLNNYDVYVKKDKIKFYFGPPFSKNLGPPK